MLSYEWVMVNKIEYPLKLLQLFKFDGRSPTMARVIATDQRYMVT